MADAAEGGEYRKKRSRPGHSKKSKKRVNSNHGGGGVKVKKIDGKMKRLFRKRAREYNSDDDENDDQNLSRQDDRDVSISDDEKKLLEAGDIDDNSADVSSNGSGEDDDGESEDDHSTAKFKDGSNAFKAAFRSIMKNTVTDDGLGPVLSAQRKLVAEKLAEEEVDKKVKGEAKKEKQLVKEKGHVMPAKYLDAHEKFLIGVATKGVVKLFNAVNKAQHAQKGLNPSRSKDEKAIKKRRKEAFFSELKKPSSSATKVGTSGEDQAPAWAPLCDNYMFSNPGLKDWDKMQDASREVTGEMPEYKSSSEDE